MTSQYETNLWSTHVNVVRLAEPIRRCVRWRTQVFKIEGFVCKHFLPSPPPSFTFWLSFHFSRGQNRKSPSSVFLCSETKRKRLLRRLHNTSHMFMQSSVERPCNTTHHTCYVYYRLKRVSTELSIWLLPCEPWLSSVAVLLALLPKGNHYGYIKENERITHDIPRTRSRVYLPTNETFEGICLALSGICLQKEL